MSYYKDQFDKINPIGKYLPTLKIRTSETETNWIDLSDECIEDLIEWLTMVQVVRVLHKSRDKWQKK